MFKKILNFIDTKINFKAFVYFLISSLAVLPISLIFSKYNITFIEEVIVLCSYVISINFFEKSFLHMFDRNKK